MVYVEYGYYKDEYGGTAIPEHDFPQIARIASKHIDNFTFDRLVGMDIAQYPSVQACTCEMAELIYETKRPGKGKEKKSENIDGYSVTYVTEATDGKIMELILKEKLYSIAEFYLMNTGLLSLEC